MNQSKLELQVADGKRGKTRASEWQLVFVLLLIGWKIGANFLSQSCSVANAKPITFRHSNENRSMTCITCFRAVTFSVFFLGGSSLRSSWHPGSSWMTWTWDSGQTSGHCPLLAWGSYRWATDTQTLTLVTSFSERQLWWIRAQRHSLSQCRPCAI